MSVPRDCESCGGAGFLVHRYDGMFRGHEAIDWCRACGGDGVREDEDDNNELTSARSDAPARLSTSTAPAEAVSRDGKAAGAAFLRLVGSA